MNVVDSCGWLEYAAGGPNCEFFAPAIEDSQRLIVPSICIYEVFRRLLQQIGEDMALETVLIMRRGTPAPLSDELAMQAAKIGAEKKLPMADSIMLATAQSFGAALWTQDVHFEGLPGVKYRAKSPAS